ncbi:AfsR/SARP family transcriptional regulator [Spirillospora sp. NPDC047279]|uniref:AfsR/SARP family transcriptional regulator n=1 Tax=Spirillospora sp. NPDC047279 TaxID=3155478 RepID=UPI0033C48866
MLHIRLLGPVEIIGGQGRSDKLSAILRRLFAVLVLRAGDGVRTEELVEELWTQEPPARVENALHAHVARLRKYLDAWEPEGPGRDRLTATPGGYALAVVPDEVDVLRFKELRRQAYDPSRDPAEAIALLERGLRLWRGPALLDAAEGPICAASASVLMDLRLLAVTHLYELRLGRGEHATLIPDLQELATAHPLEEALQDLLMLALYRSGRQAQALAVYDRLRHRLAERLGIVPGPGIQSRVQAILAQSTEFHDPDQRFVRR